MSEGIGGRLRIIREELGKTQTGMSELLGLGVRTWQTYELGNSLPKAETLKVLYDLGYSIDWILSGSGPMRAHAFRLTAASGKSRSFFNPGSFGEVLESLSRLYREENVRVSTVDLGDVARELFADLANVVDKAEWRGALRYAINLKRRTLRQVHDDLAKG